MADPATLAGVGMAGSVAQGLLGAFGANVKGEADASAYQYQAGIARINEGIAKSNADYERHVGEIQAQQEGMKTAQDIGGTKATQAGSGVDVNKGSAAAVRDTQLEVGQYDQAMIRSNAARKAYGYEVEAVSEEAKARMAESASSNARTGGKLGALTSLISAGGSVASKWMQYGSTFGKGQSQGNPGPYLAPVGEG